MVMKILVALAILAAVLAGVVALQPSEFRVTRSAAIAAPPSAIFPHVNNLYHWKAWSPWARLDPNAQETFEGPAEGKGAVMKWAGNKNVGEGAMTITESRQDELVRFNLEFLKPFKGSNTAEFTFQPEDNQTVVTWSMSGKNNFMGKAIGLFMNCDKMAGGQFEKGLANLKSVTETAKS